MGFGDSLCLDYLFLTILKEAGTWRRGEECWTKKMLPAKSTSGSVAYCCVALAKWLTLSGPLLPHL